MKPTEFFNVPPEHRVDKKLSILMPFLNESRVIVYNTHEVIRIMTTLGFNFEIVLIDDGSTDGSFDMVNAEFQNHPQVLITRNFQNFGKGWALKTGYEISTGDYILFLDSDLELSPYHIPNFYRILIEKNADVVIGSKMHPDSVLDYPLKRRIFSAVYYTMVKILFGLPVMDTQTGIKLFKREALETALPKVLVKHFAFDIELLLVLFKNHYRIEQAPIELKYSRETFTQRIKMKTIYKMIIDTLAIFYRLRILRFYDRPMGKNTRYFYSFILFAQSYNDHELSALKRYLNINYEDYEVLVIGGYRFDFSDQRLRQIQSEETSPALLLAEVMKSRPKGDIVVFATLQTYPDERLLLSCGRIFSMEEIGAAGGYVVLEQNPLDFEWISYFVKRSVFLNLDLSYRYQPANYKEVSELYFDGYFIRKDILSSIDFYTLPDLKLEYILSKQTVLAGKKIVYSPDMMLYKRFPQTPNELYGAIGEEAYYRAVHIKSNYYKKMRKWGDKRFLVSAGLLLFIIISVVLSIVSWSFWWVIPILSYYLFLFFSRVIIYGIVRGSLVFFYLVVSQIVYGIQFVRGLFKTQKRKKKLY